MKPRVAITVGDPAGIGPEIAGKAAADPAVRAVCEPLLYETPADVVMGQVSAAAGQAAYDTVVRAVADARAGHIDAIATAPVNKAAFAAAGLPWKGHTDLLGHLCGVAARGDDVPHADAEGGARHRPRRARRRAGAAHSRACSRRRSS